MSRHGFDFKRCESGQVALASLAISLTVAGCAPTQNSDSSEIGSGTSAPSMESLSAPDHELSNSAIRSALTFLDVADQRGVLVDKAFDAQGGFITTDPDLSSISEELEAPQVTVDRNLDVDWNGNDSMATNRLGIRATGPSEAGRLCETTISFAFTSASSLATERNFSIGLAREALTSRTGLQLSELSVSRSRSVNEVGQTRQVYFDDVNTGKYSDASGPDGALRVLSDDELRDTERVLRDTVDCLSSRRPLDEGPGVITARTLAEWGVCRVQCLISSVLNISHPTWGAVKLYATIATRESGAVEANLVAVDAQGKDRWRYSNDLWKHLAAPAVSSDKSGNIFLEYRISSDLGIAVLRPDGDGFNDLHTLPGREGYEKRFEWALINDTDRTGFFDIWASRLVCSTTDCASRVVTYTPYRWTGSDYVPR